jgi:excisionase family DNA binding protein
MADGYVELAEMQIAAADDSLPKCKLPERMRLSGCQSAFRQFRSIGFWRCQGLAEMITNEIKLVLRALVDGHFAMAKSLEAALREVQDLEKGEKAQWQASTTKTQWQSKLRQVGVAEAAQLLNMTAGALENLRRTGSGPPYQKFRGSIKYGIGELEIWAASRLHAKGEGHTDSLTTIKEAGDILKISRSTLYLMIGQGKLPIVRIGRSTRIRRSDLNKMMRLPFSE